MKRYRFTLEYDGSRFLGWQRQSMRNGIRNGMPMGAQTALAKTVQQALEDQLIFFTKHPVTIFGAGRTDSGVHATGQVAHADLDYPHSTYRLQVALNHFLAPQGLSVIACEVVDANFHARYSAKYRCYQYRILNRIAPSVLDPAVWHVGRPLDAMLMHQSAQKLVGTHDFSSFRDSRCQSKTPIKTLTQFDIERHGEQIIATIKAPSFLYHQVRIMIGTLKSVGAGVISLEKFISIRDAKDRTKAGLTAPACGLTLTKVGYSQKSLPTGS